MAGHMISLYLKEQGYEVTGFARMESDLVDTIVADAEDKAAVEKAVFSKDYDYVINCVGILNQYAEGDKSRAVYLNAFLPHYLADITREHTAKIIHLSTDCVFSGRRGSYKEDDLRDGNTFYDRSKALGELEDNKNVTIRTSIVGPDRNEQGIGLLNWFMKQNTKVKGYARAFWTGQTTLQLAKTIEMISLDEISGLCNIVPETYISKLELLQLFNKYLRDNELDIEADNTINIDKSLIQTHTHIPVPSYEKMVQELHIWISSHKQLYPVYYLK